ncbi:MAG: mechanosensitive ion channel family protein [Owenweeksia sp.]|nr:mechanosensitive ion channel family protein [Owenweeksia sp.]
MKEVNFDVNKAYALLSEKLEEWISASIKMLPNMVVATLVLLLFVLLGKLTKKLFVRLISRVSDNKSMRSLMGSLLYVSIVAVGTFIALSILQLDGAVTSLLAGAGVIGLALGFAFQEIAANFMAGTMMNIRKPFKEGDLVKTNDILGIVEKIHLRTTEIRTLQGQMVLIPNAEVFKKPIENFSYSGKRRIDLSVGVTYDTDLEFAKRVATEAVQALEGINPNEVSLYFGEFGNSSINFTIRYWITFGSKQFEYWDAMDRGIIAIKKSFDKNGITIPFPIHTLELGNVDFDGIF